MYAYNAGGKDAVFFSCSDARQIFVKIVPPLSVEKE